jgi:hypothetical protein
VRLFVGPRFSQLLHNPGSSWISRHAETQNLSPVVAYDEEAIQNAKRERRHGEEVHGCDGFTMVPKERQPMLGRIWSSRESPQAS